MIPSRSLEFFTIHITSGVASMKITLNSGFDTVRINWKYVKHVIDPEI